MNTKVKTFEDLEDYVYDFAKEKAIGLARLFGNPAGFYTQDKKVLKMFSEIKAQEWLTLAKKRFENLIGIINDEYLLIMLSKAIYNQIPGINKTYVSKDEG